MITRRRFAHTLGGTIALTAIKPANLWSTESIPTATAAAVSGSNEAAELYRKAFTLDCNTLAGIGFPLDPTDSAGYAKRIRDSGVNVVKATLGGADGDFETTLTAISRAELLVEKMPDLFLKVNRPADLDRAHNERKVGIIFSFEAARMLEDKIERIELFRDLGVRVMQLSYNRRSPFGVGCLDGETDGLTDLGRRAIGRMNETGVALDLSHANTKTTADGIQASAKPPVMTHAGCRAVFMHPRNKEDREMKALAEKGGVMGIYMLPYLTASPKQPMLEDYVRHMEHAIKVCGEDHVGIGSDVPFFAVDQAMLDEMKKDEAERKAAGIAAPGEDRPPYIPDLNSERKMERIADALLKRGYKNGAVEKVLGGNFRRVLGEIWNA
jgi:membrane dipeptidase